MSIVQRCSDCIWNNGLVCVAFAAIGFSVAALLVRPIDSNTPVFEIVAVRSAFSLALSFASAKYKDIRPIFGKCENMPFLAFRGLVGAAAMDCFYYSVQRLFLAEAIALLFCNPAITAVLAWVFLGERLSIVGALGCLVSLCGMVLVVRPPFLLSPEEAGEWDFERTKGVIAGAASALLAGLAYMTIRAIGKKEHSLSVAVWFHTSALVHSVLFLLVMLKTAVAPAPYEWGCFVGIACCSFTANLLISRGLQLESAALGSAVNYSQVVYAHIIGAVFFDEPLRFLSMIGAGLIALGVVALALGSTKKNSDDEPSEVVDEEEQTSLLEDKGAESGAEMVNLAQASV